MLVPPGQDPNDWELLGYTSEQVNKFAFTALTRRLKVIGVPLVAPEPAAAVGTFIELQLAELRPARVGLGIVPVLRPGWRR